MRIILQLLLLSSAASAFGTRNCRNFQSNQLVQNFKLDDFLGEWFPYYRSKQTYVVSGRCPVMYFGYRVPDSPSQARRLKKYAQVRDDVDISSSYKGSAGLSDNLQYYKAYFNKGTSSGSQWIGSTVNPMKMFEGNYQVVATDYDTYAITYQCTSQSVMYDRDDIVIFTRESPGYGHISQDTEQKIRKDFSRIFGNEIDDERKLATEIEQDKCELTPVAPAGGAKVPDLTKVDRDAELLKDGQARLPLPADQLIEGNYDTNVGSVPESTTKLRWESFQKPLIFDEHLRTQDHGGCEQGMYPDLSLSTTQRLKQENERVRQMARITNEDY